MNERLYQQNPLELTSWVQRYNILKEDIKNPFQKAFTRSFYLTNNIK